MKMGKLMTYKWSGILIYMNFVEKTCTGCIYIHLGKQLDGLFFLVSHLGTYVVSAHAQTRTNSTHAHHTPRVHERTYNYAKTLFINSC